MEKAISFSSSALFTPLPLSSNDTKSRPELQLRRGKRDYRKGLILARRRDSYEWDYKSSLVDESMIILRKRMHEMKMVERNYEPPAEWMECEKQCYTQYDEFICRFVGLLQIYMMNTRPSLALGMLTLVAMGVPVTIAVVASRLMEVANGVLSNVQFG